MSRPRRGEPACEKQTRADRAPGPPQNPRGPQTTAGRKTASRKTTASRKPPSGRKPPPARKSPASCGGETGDRQKTTKTKRYDLSHSPSAAADAPCGGRPAAPAARRGRSFGQGPLPYGDRHRRGCRRPAHALHAPGQPGGGGAGRHRLGGGPDARTGGGADGCPAPRVPSRRNPRRRGPRGRGPGSRLARPLRPHRLGRQHRPSRPFSGRVRAARRNLRQ